MCIYRDVLNVLGMYPGDPGHPGSDCAGVVMSVGKNVAQLKPGTFEEAFYRNSTYTETLFYIKKMILS